MRIKWLFFKQNWIPFNQVSFVPSLSEIGPVILEKKIEQTESSSPKNALCQSLVEIGLVV